MPIILRDYQIELKRLIYEAWQSGHRNVLAVLPTGMGKTKKFCSLTIDVAILSQTKTPTVIMVHRKELVQQISITLAEEHIPHNIIAPRPVIKGIVAAHRRLLKKQFYDFNSIVTVVSVDTLNARIEKHAKWAQSIRLWITDEATHLLKNNKWGRAVEYFPNAVGLGVTATPQRLDKRGLGRHADGVFDVMVQGPSTRWGIDNGYLCKYKIAIPSSDYQRYLGKAADGSDYSAKAMAAASAQSQIVGDMVLNYKKFANGKQAIYFVTDIITGKRTEKKFNDAGVRAVLLTSENTDKERLDALIDYRDKKIKVLINIDLFDEGLDVPGIEAVGMGRPTKSLTKFLQILSVSVQTRNATRPTIERFPNVLGAVRQRLPR
jgi:DNA repair protein RadD